MEETRTAPSHGDELACCKGGNSILATRREVPVVISVVAGPFLLSIEYATPAVITGYSEAVFCSIPWSIPLIDRALLVLFLKRPRLSLTAFILDAERDISVVGPPDSSLPSIVPLGYLSD